MSWVWIFALSIAGSAPLAAWRWYLAERRFELLNKNETRDEALASLEPRMRSLEERMNAFDWKRAIK